MFKKLFGSLKSVPLAEEKSATTTASTRELICAAYRAGGAIDTRHCTYGPAPFKKTSDYGHMPYYRLLAGFVRLLKAQTIVEIGTYHGGSTLAFAAGFSGTRQEKILTIDPENFAQERLSLIPSIKRFQGLFPDAACLDFLGQELGTKRIDILYIDALKDRAFVEAAVAACNKWQPRLLILDDINATDSMEAMWNANFSHKAGACRLSDVLGGVRNSEFDFGICVEDEQLIKNCSSDIMEQNGDSAFADITVGEPYQFALQDFDKQTKTMMTRNETGMLNRLVSDHYHGLGQIVDAGAFLGGSTVSMGLALVNKKAPLHHRIHSYDRFTNFDPYFDRFMSPPVERFQSYLPQFVKNISSVLGHVNIYPGEFCQQRWSGQPIELFFADIAKSPTLNAHLYSEFSRYWIPGHTIYVQQDFVHLEAPWIQYVIGYLSDYFTIVGVEAPSLILGVRRMVPAEMIARIVADDFSWEEKAEFLERLANRFSDPETVLALRLIKARITADSGDLNAAKALLKQLEANSRLMSHPNSMRRVERTRELLGIKAPAQAK